MLLPDLFENNLLNSFMDDDWTNKFFDAPAQRPVSMKTDVRETEHGYELGIELPGYKKEDVKAELHDGYLTVTASHTENKDEKDKEGHYIRRERYHGACRRSFYVGKDVGQEDIKAKFEDGILKLDIPKPDQKKVEEKRMIAIEG